MFGLYARNIYGKFMRRDFFIIMNKMAHQYLFKCSGMGLTL